MPGKCGKCGKPLSAFGACLHCLLGPRVAEKFEAPVVAVGLDRVGERVPCKGEGHEHCQEFCHLEYVKETYK